MIVDKNKDDKWTNDSWAIAKYLETTYPDRKSLFGGSAGDIIAAMILRRGCSRLLVRNII